MKKTGKIFIALYFALILAAVLIISCPTEKGDSINHSLKTTVNLDADGCVSCAETALLQEEWENMWWGAGRRSTNDDNGLYYYSKYDPFVNIGIMGPGTWIPAFFTTAEPLRDKNSCGLRQWEKNQRFDEKKGKWVYCEVGFTPMVDASSKPHTCKQWFYPFESEEAYNEAAAVVRIGTPEDEGVWYNKTDPNGRVFVGEGQWFSPETHTNVPPLFDEAGRMLTPQWFYDELGIWAGDHTSTYLPPFDRDLDRRRPIRELPEVPNKYEW